MKNWGKILPIVQNLFARRKLSKAKDPTLRKCKAEIRVMEHSPPLPGYIISHVASQMSGYG
jgi:hypothetical protein